MMGGDSTANTISAADYASELELECAHHAARASNWVKCEGHLVRFFELAPSDARGVVLHAKVLAQQGRFVESQQALMRAAELGFDPSVLALMQQDLMRLSDRAIAIRNQVRAAIRGAMSSLRYCFDFSKSRNSEPSKAPRFHLEFGLTVLVLLVCTCVMMQEVAHISEVPNQDLVSFGSVAAVFMSIFFTALFVVFHRSGPSYNA